MLTGDISKTERVFQAWLLRPEGIHCHRAVWLRSKECTVKFKSLEASLVVRTSLDHRYQRDLSRSLR